MPDENLDPNPPPTTTVVELNRRNARLGLRLFAIYLLFYAGFVLLNALSPALMEREIFAGINLAVVYGVSLIFAAFAISLIYACLCRDASQTESRS